MSTSDCFVSIFNDVIGPVMRGPSSSHTAGAYRIAQLVRSLYGGLPESVECAFDPTGSYAPTYKPLGVDKAFCAGLIGLDMLGSSYELAVEQAGGLLAISFVVEPLELADHPNAVRIRLRGSRDLTIWAKSTGGGVVELYHIEGFGEGRPDGSLIAVSGKERIALLSLPERVSELSTPSEGDNDRLALRTFLRRASQEPDAPEPPDHGQTPPDATSVPRLLQIPINATELPSLEEWKATYGIDYLVAEPVFFPRAEGAAGGEHSGGPAAGWNSFEQILARAERMGWSLGETALAFECELLSLSKDKALSEMEQRYEIMRASVAAGYDEESTSLAWLSPHARRMKGAYDQGALPYGGFHTLAAIRAHAAMHTCNSRGVVCAAPTGGSAGVLPGVLMTLEEELGYSREQVLRALFAAGLVGVIFAKRATFAAESAGCQVEIGAAGAMAAAAAVDCAGGSAASALDAAAISLQNTMGSICDPVGGGCEIPCHTRNGVAASSAFVTADMVIAGYRNPIPLDETIDAAYDVGTRLHSDFRCTARGGIAVTPTALRLG